MAMTLQPVSMFPNDHLMGPTPASRGSQTPQKGMASGAHPMSTFPNYLSRGPAAAAAPQWAASSTSDPVRALREKAGATDWELLFSEGKTSTRADAAWSAGEERCRLLQMLCSVAGARQVLEVGSFCGAAALSMAEALPQEGRVVALELDAFLADFGAEFRAQSEAGGRISHLVGPAAETLPALAERVAAGEARPFDFAVVDADKAGMAGYLRTLWSSGLLAEGATVCVDVTPFKGQLPHRYAKYGMADHWVVPSGQEEIDALRGSLADSKEFSAWESGGLLIVRRR